MFGGYVLMLWCPSSPIKYLNICAPLHWAHHIYLRFLSTKYMRPLMSVIGKLIQART